jgi:SAM-dependent methyltransferase
VGSPLTVDPLPFTLMTEWFQEWFGEDYLRLYPHRDAAEAGRMVALLKSNLPWRAGLRTLDVGCGAGRHARALAEAGAQVTGVDLSRTLLARARECTAANFARADMRHLPVRPRSMDLVVNLFTSFGYFSSDAEHARVLAAMIETLRPGGWFAIDFLHAPAVIASLVPEADLELGGTPVHVSKALVDDRRAVVKTIALADGRTFTERVRLFRPEELEQMIGAAGGTVRCRFGDYDGGPILGTSPGAILFAERAA